MARARVVFAHGLEGAPHGTKGRALRAAGVDLHAPDCRGMSLAERLVVLDALTAEGEGAPQVLVGSSYGGLAGAWLAAQHPGRFSAMVLLAPALQRVEAPVLEPHTLKAPPGLQTVIIHGRNDCSVPIEGSRAYAVRSGAHVELIEVDDGHRLSGMIDHIVGVVRRVGG